MKLISLFSLALLVQTSSAFGMLRVLKYKPLTEVSKNQICIYTRHEMNPKKENIGHAQNTKAPIVCRLSLTAEATPSQASSKAGSKLIKADAVQRFNFEVLQKTCANFDATLPKGYALSKFSGLTTECSTEEAGARVFPEYAKQKAAASKKRHSKQS